MNLESLQRDLTFAGPISADHERKCRRDRDLKPGWSPNGQLLYYTAQADAHSCSPAQHTASFRTQHVFIHRQDKLKHVLH